MKHPHPGSWIPDPELVLYLEDKSRKNFGRITVRLTAGELVLPFSWGDILNQVLKGTEFGRGYQQAFLGSLNEKSIHRASRRLAS